MSIHKVFSVGLETIVPAIIAAGKISAQAN
jgi:hypothetical protein